jgi:hypothetical protein
MVTNTVDPPDEASGGSTSTLTTSPAPVRSSSNSKKPRKKRISPAKQNSGSGTPEAGAAGVFVPPKTSLVYNEYGELVDIEKIKRPHSSADLSVTETLRLIRKAYHHEVSHLRPRPRNFMTRIGLLTLSCSFEHE